MELSFSSNLGEQITSSDVSGPHRFRFFSNAVALPSQQSELLPPSSPLNGEQENHQYQYHEKVFAESGSQTDAYIHIVNQEEKDKRQKALHEEAIRRQIQLKRKARAKERHEQEAALPPMTNEEGVQAYRRFLEENEKKDYSLRETELDEAIQRKLMTIQEDLKKRYGNDEEMKDAPKSVRLKRGPSTEKIEGIWEQKGNAGSNNISTWYRSSALDVNSGVPDGLTTLCRNNDARRNYWKNVKHNRRIEHARCLDLVESTF